MNSGIAQSISQSDDEDGLAKENRAGLLRIKGMVGLLFGGSKTSTVLMDYCGRGNTMSINMDDKKNIPPDTEAC
jgi:hypothetical protein